MISLFREIANYELSALLVMAYMEIFGNASHTNHGIHEDATLMRHSMHSFTHSSRFQR